MKTFEPAKLGALTLANRFIRSATGEGMSAQAGYCTSILAKTMTDLASGGVGLIISGHTAVSPEGRAGGKQLCLWHEDHLAALSDMPASFPEPGDGRKKTGEEKSDLGELRTRFSSMKHDYFLKRFSNLSFGLSMDSPLFTAVSLKRK